jgi:hypothetical protein
MLDASWTVVSCMSSSYNGVKQPCQVARMGANPLRLILDVGSDRWAASQSTLRGP